MEVADLSAIWREGTTKPIRFCRRRGSQTCRRSGAKGQRNQSASAEGVGARLVGDLARSGSKPCACGGSDALHRLTLLPVPGRSPTSLAPTACGPNQHPTALPAATRLAGGGVFKDAPPANRTATGGAFAQIVRVFNASAMNSAWRMARMTMVNVCFSCRTSKPLAPVSSHWARPSSSVWTQACSTSRSSAIRTSTGSKSCRPTCWAI